MAARLLRLAAPPKAGALGAASPAPSAWVRVPLPARKVRPARQLRLMVFGELGLWGLV